MSCEHFNILRLYTLTALHLSTVVNLQMVSKTCHEHKGLSVKFGFYLGCRTFTRVFLHRGISIFTTERYPLPKIAVISFYFLVTAAKCSKKICLLK